MRPPGAASLSAKSIQEDEIPLAVMAGRMKKFSENTSTNSSTLNFNPHFSWFFVGGTSVPIRVSPGKPWSISSVCKNFRAQHPLRAKIQSLEKSPSGCKFIRVNNFFVCGPKYINFFSSNVGGVVDDQELFRFLKC